MLARAYDTLMYGAIFLSLFFLDYVLGNGFVDVSQKVFCKVACFIKRSIREEARLAQATQENPINVPILFAEIIALTMTIAFLKKYKNIRCRDRMDELLQESKDSLKQTNEFLEKWRLRRETFTNKRIFYAKPIKPYTKVSESAGGRSTFTDLITR
ncbi:hypothetical protein evm_011217 [Chilo suppressalis]|nr:hypothetical protein evm_011217 [Chilo suppressalis]